MYKDVLSGLLLLQILSAYIHADNIASEGQHTGSISVA